MTYQKGNTYLGQYGGQRRKYSRQQGKHKPHSNSPLKYKFFDLYGKSETGNFIYYSISGAAADPIKAPKIGINAVNAIKTPIKNAYGIPKILSITTNMHPRITASRH